MRTQKVLKHEFTGAFSTEDLTTLTDLAERFLELHELARQAPGTGPGTEAGAWVNECFVVRFYALLDHFHLFRADLTPNPTSHDKVAESLKLAMYALGAARNALAHSSGTVKGDEWWLKLWCECFDNRFIEDGEVLTEGIPLDKSKVLPRLKDKGLAFAAKVQAGEFILGQTENFKFCRLKRLDGEWRPAKEK